MVTKFLFGLCNAITLNYVQSLIPSEEFNLTYKGESKQMLKTLALKQLKSAASFSEILPICSWIYEMRDDEFAKLAAALLDEVINIHGDIFPSDILGLHYVLRCRKDPLRLKIFLPKFIGESRKQFFKELDTTVKCTNIRVSLKVSENYCQISQHTTLYAGVQ